jgi:hypothetical protein
MKNILTRDIFRESVFKRDQYKCVICGEKAQDAHHILERRLFNDGGYYIDNGASLCGKCHILAEQTVISCEEIRKACGITKIILPDDLGYDETYDKWGNPILPNGNRVKSELFFDESVQKILKEGDQLKVFTDYIKYPKTKHLPWSESEGKGDRWLSEEDVKNMFGDKEVVVTEKMDGENSTLYTNYLHARSIDGRNHVSRNWLKNMHSKISYNIPEKWRVCGENLFAKHSIGYKNLSSYFLAFAIFDNKNICLSWDDFKEWCNLIEIEHVPVLYRGVFDEKKIKSCYKNTSTYLGSDSQEGYVVRLAESIPFVNYKNSIAKFVRKNHVQTTHNWMFQEITKNELESV